VRRGGDGAWGYLPAPVSRRRPATLIGGLGSTLGPVVGAFISTGLEQYLADSGSWITVIQGAIFVVLAGYYRMVSYLTNALRLPLESYAARFPV
jgi:hypothetical protein